MGYEYVWVNDSVDDEQEKLNRLTYASAARRAGRDVKWVHRMIDAGRLKTVRHVERTFVVGASLAGLLLKTGVGFDPLERADQLEAQGRGMEAQTIRQRVQDEANAATPGYMGPLQSSGGEAARDRSDVFGTEFLRKYGGG